MPNSVAILPSPTNCLMHGSTAICASNLQRTRPLSNSATDRCTHCVAYAIRSQGERIVHLFCTLLLKLLKRTFLLLLFIELDNATPAGRIALASATKEENLLMASEFNILSDRGQTLRMLAWRPDGPGRESERLVVDEQTQRRGPPDTPLTQHLASLEDTEDTTSGGSTLCSIESWLSSLQ